MMIELCSCFVIRRIWPYPYSNEYHVTPWLFIISNNTKFILNNFNFRQFVVTNKRNPLIHYNWYCHLLVNFLLTNETTCFNIDKIKYFSSLSNAQKLPAPLSDKLYQYDCGSKLSIDVIREAKILRALVNEYLSSTTRSELLLLNKFVCWHLVTVISLSNDELLMTKYWLITNIILFNIDTKLSTTIAWRWLQR